MRIAVAVDGLRVLYVYEILAILAFILSLATCYAAVLIKNAKRDFDHQVPTGKAFLYALLWTPMLFFCALLVIHLIDR